MKRRFLLGLIVLVLLALACEVSTGVQTPLPTAVTPDKTGESPLAPTPTATRTATPGHPSPTPIVGSLPDVPDAAPLVFLEDFEGNYTLRRFPEVSVEESVQPFYCAYGYLGLEDADCPASEIGSGNPEGLRMGRPEFRFTDVRVLEGRRAQYWFCFWRACHAGVYVTLDTTPGDVCEIEAWAQTWSAAHEYGESLSENGALVYTQFGSDSATFDQRRNSTWFLRVDLTGGVDAFRAVQEGVFLETAFGYDAGHYDAFAPLRMTFQARGSRTTLFVANRRLWPIAFNDSALDLLTVRCIDPGRPLPAPEPTPAPQETPSVTPTPAPDPRTYDPSVMDFLPPKIYTPTGSQYVRQGHATDTAIMGGLAAGQPATAYAEWLGNDGSIWLCLDEGRRWVEHDTLNMYILSCDRWAAWRYAGSTLGTLE